jgi:hypothetical protein
VEKYDLNFVMDVPMKYLNFIIIVIIVSEKKKKDALLFIPPLIFGDGTKHEAPHYASFSTL